MAKKKLKKYPKKPKATASNEVMERWLARCNEIDKENREIEKYNKKNEELKKKIRNKKSK